MSAPAPLPTHEQIRRRVLGEAYAFALSVARRPDPPATQDDGTPCLPKPGAVAQEDDRRDELTKIDVEF